MHTYYGVFGEIGDVDSQEKRWVRTADNQIDRTRVRHTNYSVLKKMDGKRAHD